MIYLEHERKIYSLVAPHENSSVRLVHHGSTRSSTRNGIGTSLNPGISGTVFLRNSAGITEIVKTTVNCARVVGHVNAKSALDVASVATADEAEAEISDKCIHKTTNTESSNSLNDVGAEETSNARKINAEKFAIAGHNTTPLRNKSAVRIAVTIVLTRSKVRRVSNVVVVLFSHGDLCEKKRENKLQVSI